MSIISVTDVPFDIPIFAHTSVHRGGTGYCLNDLIFSDRLKKKQFASYKIICSESNGAPFALKCVCNVESIVSIGCTNRVCLRLIRKHDLLKLRTIVRESGVVTTCEIPERFECVVKNAHMRKHKCGAVEEGTAVTALIYILLSTGNVELEDGSHVWLDVSCRYISRRRSARII